MAHSHDTAQAHYNYGDLSSAINAQEAIKDMAEGAASKVQRFDQGRKANRFNTSDSRLRNQLMQKAWGRIADVMEDVWSNDKLLKMKIKYNPAREDYTVGESDDEENEETEEEKRSRGGAGYHDGSKLKRLAQGKEAHENKNAVKLNKEQIITRILKRELRPHDTLQIKDIPVDDIPLGMTAKQIVDTFK